MHEVRVVKLSTISAKVGKFTYSLKVLNSLTLRRDSHVLDMSYQKLTYLGLIGFIRSLLFNALQKVFVIILILLILALDSR